jgi:hypothetical protein
VTIDLDSADEMFNDWGNDVLDGNCVTSMGVDTDGVYYVVYKVRDQLISFEDVEVLKE